MPNEFGMWVIENSKEEKFLREKTEAFDFSRHTKKEIAELVRKMRKLMKAANGIGLSANQIGLPWRFFVAEVEGQNGPKFYAVFNPKIEKSGGAKELEEEGCLSIPGIYGEVGRASKVTLKGQDQHGRPLKIKAWGLLARVFQHETDHLEGKLITDRAKRTYKAEPHPSKSRDK